MIYITYIFFYFNIYYMYTICILYVYYMYIICFVIYITGILCVYCTLYVCLFRWLTEYESVFA